MRAILSIVSGKREDADARLKVLQANFPSAKFSIGERPRKHEVILESGERIDTPTLESMKRIAGGYVPSDKNKKKEKEDATRRTVTGPGAQPAPVRVAGTAT